MNIKKQLTQFECFSKVKPETIEKMVQVGRILEVKKGTILIHAKQSLGSVYFQLAGKSIIYNLTHLGKRKILFILGKGALLNEHLFNQYVSYIYCETIEKSKIFAIPCSEFMILMEEDFQLTKNMFAAQERKIWRLGHQLKNTMSSIYLEKKLAAKLWKLARDFGIPKEDGIEIDMNMTVTFLADMLGVPRETTSRICTTLMEYRLIKMYKKRITVLNPEQLAIFYKTGKFE